MTKEEIEEKIDRGYPTLKDYTDVLKPYIKDSLEMRRRLERNILHKTIKIYNDVFAPILFDIEIQKGDFKGIDKHLHQLFEKATKELNEKLGFLIYETLKSGASIALSICARLKLDEEIFNGKHSLTGEARTTSPPTRDKNVIVKKIQSDVSKKSTEIAQHTIEKKRLYKEKEFTISTRVWDLSKHSIDTIRSVCEAGINMDCKKLAILLDKYVATGSSKPIKEYPNMMKRLKGRFPPDISFAAMRLARNELSEVYFTTSIKDYMENPYIEAVQWLLANNRLKMYEDRCDCNDIAYEDVYGLGRGIYPLDKVPDRPHVMCLCTLAPITSRKLKKQLEGGMKLGNTPTEEWFEKQEAQLKLDLLQDTSEQASSYSLKKFEWLNKTKENEKVLLLEDFSRVNPFIIKKINSCQNPLIADIHYERNSHFNITENKIYYNAFIKDPRSIEAGFNTNMTGFLHEAGHYLDYNLSKDGKPLHTKMKDLDSFLKKDTLDFVNGIYRKRLGKLAVDFKNLSVQELKKGLDFYKRLGNLKNIKDLDKLVVDELKQNKAVNSFVSDLIDGVTNGCLLPSKIDLYKHDVYYWTEDTIKAELVAHFFEVIGSGGDRLKVFYSAFPDSYRYLLNKIR